eukprot:COSAG01_NODE_33043_length_571_cov_0.631356_2_plen_34_part_01
MRRVIPTRRFSLWKINYTHTTELLSFFADSLYNI